MVICGLGVGPTLPLYPLAIQNAVDIREIGQATSAGQFFRQIGGAVGAAVMGTVLAVTLATAMPQGSPGGAAASSSHTVRPAAPPSAGGAASAQAPEAPAEALQAGKAVFTTAINRIYLYVGFLVVAAWIVTCFVPELPLRTTNAPASSVADAPARSESDRSPV
jgi:hypothetical protein